MGVAVGKIVRDLREKRGISQSYLARRLKLKTAQSISNIERGVSPLPATKIRTLSRVLRADALAVVDAVIAEKRERYLRLAGVVGRTR